MQTKLASTVKQISRADMALLIEKSFPHLPEATKRDLLFGCVLSTRSGSFQAPVNDAMRINHVTTARVTKVASEAT